MALTESLEWLRELKYKELEQNEEATFILNSLRTFINQGELLPHGSKIEDVSSEGVYLKDGNGHPIEITEMSDGFRSILSLTFELLRQMVLTYGAKQVFKDFEAGNYTISMPGVVIIDEIDAHLHPTWQARIGQWFTKYFPRVQFIVTTHSPIICRAAERGSVWRLAAPGSGAQAERVEGTALKRLIYGNILDAYSTELFGEGTTSSAGTTRMLEELAQLNKKSITGQISDERKKAARGALEYTAYRIGPFMIRLPDKSLSNATLAALTSYQQEVDGAGGYAEQVAKAKEIWPSRRRNSLSMKSKAHLLKCAPVPVGVGIARTLWRMKWSTSGPKTFTRSVRSFGATTSMPAGRAMGRKTINLPFSQMPSQSRSRKLAHPKTGPVQPPPGSPVLIDPRVEDPLQYLWLDVIDTFAFTPVADDKNTISWKRADYTVNVLNLNSRDALIEARRLAYGRYRSRLFEYVNRMADGAAPEQLQRIEAEIKREGHPTVWREMKRQQALIPALRELFDQAPQALNW